MTANGRGLLDCLSIRRRCFINHGSLIAKACSLRQTAARWPPHTQIYTQQLATTEVVPVRTDISPIFTTVLKATIWHISHYQGVARPNLLRRGRKEWVPSPAGYRALGGVWGAAKPPETRKMC